MAPNDVDWQAVLEAETASLRAEIRQLETYRMQIQAVVEYCNCLPNDPTAMALLVMLRMIRESDT